MPLSLYHFKATKEANRKLSFHYKQEFTDEAFEEFGFKQFLQTKKFPYQSNELGIYAKEIGFMGPGMKREFYELFREGVAYPRKESFESLLVHIEDYMEIADIYNIRENFIGRYEQGVSFLWATW